MIVGTVPEPPAATVPDLQHRLVEYQAVLGLQQRNPSPQLVTNNRRVVPFGSKPQKRELEATLAELSAVTGSLVASGPAENRHHVAGETDLSLWQKVADGHGNLNRPGSMPHTDFPGSRCQGNNGPRLRNRCHSRVTDAVRNTTSEIQRPTPVVGSGHLQLQPGEVPHEPGMRRLDTERPGRILRMDANFSNGYHG